MPGRIAVDSGAGANVWSKELLNTGPMKGKAKEINFEAVNGTKNG